MDQGARAAWIKEPGTRWTGAMDQGARWIGSHGSKGQGPGDRQAMYRRTRGQLDREPWIKGPGARWIRALKQRARARLRGGKQRGVDREFMVEVKGTVSPV
jgi:hypothetical protein